MSPRRRAVYRCFALALMVNLAGDLLDAACDPIPSPTLATTVAADQPAEADACGGTCGGTCVADCYCCSAVDGLAVDAATNPLGFLRMTTLPVPPQAPSHTAAPPDQPPTRL
jgi:hypothetical protein